MLRCAPHRNTTQGGTQSEASTIWQLAIRLEVKRNRRGNAAVLLHRAISAQTITMMPTRDRATHGLRIGRDMYWCCLRNAATAKTSASVSPAKMMPSSAVICTPYAVSHDHTRSKAATCVRGGLVLSCGVAWYSARGR